MWQKSYIYAGSRLLSTFTKNGSGETLEFHHPDRLGTRLVTNPAANNSFEQSTLPFGTALDAESTGATNQRFTSYDRSNVASLDYAVNRSYSPGQGRFTSPDPIGMSAASLGNPQSLNMYAYVENNPIDFTDPSGLFMITPTDDAPIVIEAPGRYWHEPDWSGFYRFWRDSRGGGGGLIQPIISDSGLGAGGTTPVEPREPQPSPPDDRKKCTGSNCPITDTPEYRKRYIECVSVAQKRRDVRFTQVQKQFDEYDTSLKADDWADIAFGTIVGTIAFGGTPVGTAKGFVLSVVASKFGKNFLRYGNRWAANREVEMQFLGEAAQCGQRPRRLY